jgi:hypothetical protein
VFVALVPPSVNDLGYRWVFAVTLEFFIWYTRLFALLLKRLSKWVIGSRVCLCIGIGRARSGFGGLRRVVEDGAIETGDSVEEEVIDLVVLWPMLVG